MSRNLIDLKKLKWYYRAISQIEMEVLRMELPVIALGVLLVWFFAVKMFGSVQKGTAFIGIVFLIGLVIAIVSYLFGTTGILALFLLFFFIMLLS